jgi:hypothetical protein
MGAENGLSLLDEAVFREDSRLRCFESLFLSL